MLLGSLSRVTAAVALGTPRRYAPAPLLQMPMALSARTAKARDTLSRIALAKEEESMCRTPPRAVMARAKAKARRAKARAKANMMHRANISMERARV